MAESKKDKLLEILKNAKGYDMALFTSFNFELQFFERAILNRLYTNEIRKVSLFIDYGQFNKALAETKKSSIGRKYIVNPVKIGTSFHPKVILLLGEKKAKLIVGSANIKLSGMAINNEIFNYIDYDENHQEYLDVINDAIRFFLKINELSFQLDQDLIKEMTNYIYYRKTRSNDEIFLFDNLEKSMLVQAKEKMIETVKTIKIAVPYYDNGLEAFHELQRTFPQAKIELFIQNKRSTFPVALNTKEKIAKHIHVFDGFTCQKNGANRFYHGKVFVFQTDTKDYALYGSSNCTKAALTKSYQEQGNVECDFFAIGEVGEFDYFFEEMNLLPKESLVSNVMVYEPTAPSKVSFLYGEESNTVELHFKTSYKKNAFKVFYQENELEFYYKAEELIVLLPEELLYFVEEVFDVEFHFSQETEIVKCWVINRLQIENNRRLKMVENLWDDDERDTDEDKYREDKIRLYQAEATCIQGLNACQKKMEKNVRDAEDEEDPENYVVDTDIPDEYRVYQRQYQQIEKICNIHFSRFLNQYPSIFTMTGEPCNGKEKSKETSRKSRTPDSLEKKFARLIKGHTRNLLHENFYEKTTANHYIGLMATLFDIFKKYEDCKGMFDPNYVLNTKVTYVDIVLKNKRADMDEESKESFLAFCLELFLDLYERREKEEDVEIRETLDGMSRKLLLDMDEAYKIRENYPDYLRQYSLSRDLIFKGEGFKSICEYIEKGFGYKTEKLLKQYIEKIYPNAAVRVEDDRFIVDVVTSGERLLIMPDSGVLREIKNYSNANPGIQMAEINIEREELYIGNQNLIKKIRYEVNLNQHSYVETIERFNGKVTKEKAKHIDF